MPEHIPKKQKVYKPTEKPESWKWEKFYGRVKKHYKGIPLKKLDTRKYKTKDELQRAVLGAQLKITRKKYRRIGGKR